jgi:hypothetical protein
MDPTESQYIDKTATKYQPFLTVRTVKRKIKSFQAVPIF